MTDAIQKAREALTEAIDFADQDFQVLTPTGEEMVNRWRAALAALDAETEATPADVGEEPVGKYRKLERELSSTKNTDLRAAQAERMARLEEAARDVVWFDWSDNDDDAVAAIERLRAALGGIADA